jgi:DNA-binding ferritin-like protein
MKKFAETSPTVKSLGTYISFLRAIYLIEQNDHWEVKSSGFYGDHLLMQRLYETTLENVDAIAEKSLALFGSDTLNISAQITLIKTIIDKYKDLKPLERSLAAVQEFLQISTHTYKEIKDSGDMTLGLDDLILHIHSDQETSVYLLQQTLV